MSHKSSSYVIEIPKDFPFDKAESRWPTFLGEVIAHVVQDKNCLFWFAYYTDIARFRTYADENEDIKIRQALEDRMTKFKLSYRIGEDGKPEEWDYKLENDLGGPRFLGSERTDVSATERGVKVLTLLHAGCQLFLHTLVKEGSYWREEVCKNPNNPYDSSSRSYIHLLHNLAQSDVQTVVFFQGLSCDVLSEYTFSNALEKGLIQPVHAHAVRLTV